MTKNNPSSSTVFLDTSFFKAYIDAKDEFHTQAQAVWQKLKEENTFFVTSNYILIESFTLIKFRCGRKVVSGFRELLGESESFMKIVRVTIADEARAWDWFLLDWSKLSFTDCVSFALMKRLGLKRVATFDTHFERAGFEIEK